MHTLFLSAGEISAVIRSTGVHVFMDDLIGKLTAACVSFDAEFCSIPPRSGFNYETPYPGLVEWMPLMAHGDHILMKMVGYHPQNPHAQQLPTILCTLALFDAKSGHLIALADGTFLTALRTGAASAVASRYLAHPESRVLGLVGAGAQAVSQLHAVSRLFDLEQVLIYDSHPERAEDFADRATPVAPEGMLIAPSSLPEIMEQSDIICTATSVEPGSGPVLPADVPTKPWLHINAVGSDFPGKIEVPREFLERSFVCPDFREQVEREGECQQLSSDQIGPELLEVSKAPEAFVCYQEERSVFDSTGFALEDEVALSLLLSRAQECGRGLPMAFESIPSNPYHPYQFLEESSSMSTPVTRP